MLRSSAGNMLAGAKKVKFFISKLAMSTYFLNPIFFYLTHLSAAPNAPPISKSAGNMLAGAKKVKFVISKLAMSSCLLKPFFLFHSPECSPKCSADFKFCWEHVGWGEEVEVGRLKVDNVTIHL
jgi:hypothetical protein